MLQKHVTLAFVMLLLTVSMLSWSSVDAFIQGGNERAVEPQVTATLTRTPGSGPSPTPTWRPTPPPPPPGPTHAASPSPTPVYCEEYPDGECPEPTSEPYPYPYPIDCEIDPELCEYPPPPTFTPPRNTPTTFATRVIETRQPLPSPTVRPTSTATPHIRIDSPNLPASAFLTVVQRSEPNLVTGPGTVVVFTVEVMNRGAGAATNVVVALPIDPAEVVVVDVQLSRPDAWVSGLLPDRIELSIDKALAPGEHVTATVRLRVLPAVTLGAGLGERLTVRWSDDAEGGARHGNVASLTAGETNQSASSYPLQVETAAESAGTLYTFRAGIFAPDEPVSLWWNTPTGANIAKGELWASADGTITTTVNTAGLAPGAYRVVAYAQWTTFTAVGSFEVR